MRAMIALKAQLKDSGIRLVDLAAKLKVNKATVTRWHQKKVPAERVLEVARVTGIPKEKLRPDLYESEERT
jgi:DNA-binding transcriptional regulator YdaS (Cro superfamily)